MMEPVGFEWQLSDREIDVIVSKARELTLSSLYNISKPTQNLLRLESKVAYFYVEIDVNEERGDDVIEQITYVVSRKSRDSILLKLDEDISSKLRVQETDRIFVRFCDRLLEISNGTVFIYLAGCQEADKLGKRFIAFVKKDECIKGLPNIHYILACDNKTTAIANNRIFNFSKEINAKELFYMNDTNKPYISHTWSGQSDLCSNQIVDALKQRKIPYSIDRVDCKYLDDIRRYEDKLINASIIIAVIDKDYLRSINSMAELSYIFSNGNQSKIMPVLAGGREDVGKDMQAPLTEFWEKESKKLKNKMRLPHGDENKNYARDLEAIDHILKQIPNIFQYLTDVNVQSANDLFAPDKIDDFYGEICKRLGKKYSSKENENTTVNVNADHVYKAEKMNIFNGTVNVKNLEM